MAAAGGGGPGTVEVPADDPESLVQRFRSQLARSSRPLDVATLTWLTDAAVADRDTALLAALRRRDDLPDALRQVTDQHLTAKMVASQVARDREAVPASALAQLAASDTRVAVAAAIAGRPDLDAATAQVLARRGHPAVSFALAGNTVVVGEVREAVVETLVDHLHSKVATPRHHDVLAWLLSDDDNLAVCATLDQLPLRLLLHPSLNYRHLLEPRFGAALTCRLLEALRRERVSLENDRHRRVLAGVAQALLVDLPGVRTAAEGMISAWPHEREWYLLAPLAQLCAFAGRHGAAVEAVAEGRAEVAEVDELVSSLSALNTHLPLPLQRAMCLHPDVDERLLTTDAVCRLWSEAELATTVATLVGRDRVALAAAVLAQTDPTSAATVLCEEEVPAQLVAQTFDRIVASTDPERSPVRAAAVVALASKLDKTGELPMPLVRVAAGLGEGSLPVRSNDPHPWLVAAAEVAADELGVFLADPQAWALVETLVDDFDGTLTQFSATVAALAAA